MYDSIIVSLILLVDSCMLYLTYKQQQKAVRAKNARKFNKILKSVGLRIS